MTNYPTRTERVLCGWGCIVYPAVIYGIITVLVIFRLLSR
jgi:hypothetical protein